MGYKQEIIDMTLIIKNLRESHKELTPVLRKEGLDLMWEVIVGHEKLIKHIEKSHEIHCKILETCKDYRNVESLNAMASAMALLINKIYEGSQSSGGDDELDGIDGIELMHRVIKTIRSRLKNEYNFNIETEE